MKKLLIIALLALSVWGNNSEPTKIDGTITGVAPQHATRIIIQYKSSDGKAEQRSIHQTETVTDGKSIVNPQKYLPLYCKNSCLPYGPITK